MEVMHESERNTYADFSEQEKQIMGRIKSQHNWYIITLFIS